MEENFPAVYSLVSSDTLRDFVNQNYDVGRVTRCKLLTKGLNDTYRVDTEENRFILRVYRTAWRSQADICYELDALDFLFQNDVTVSAPLRSMSGKFHHAIIAPEGVRYIALFTYAKGAVPSLNESISYQYGKVVARIHNLTDNFNSPHQRFRLDFNHLLDEPMKLIQPTMLEHGGDVTYIESWVREIKNRVPIGLLNGGFCHGDFHDWNVHWEEGTLTIFDFDCCGLGYRAYDLAVFLWNLKTNYKDKVQENWQTFMDGYTEMRSLQVIDARSIPLFVAARRIWLAGVYLANEDVYGTAIINKDFFRSFVNQLKEDEQELGLSI